MTRPWSIYAGVIAGLVVIAGIVGTVVAVWEKLQPAVQGAIVGGAFTVISAASAATVVFWQLRRQALNTIGSRRTYGRTLPGARTFRRYTRSSSTPA